MEVILVETQPNDNIVIKYKDDIILVEVEDKNIYPDLLIEYTFEKLEEQDI